MPISDAKRRANQKYFSNHWTQIKLSMPKEEAAALRQYCSDHGLAVAGFIRGLIRNAIAADSAADPVQDDTHATRTTGGGESRGADLSG